MTLAAGGEYGAGVGVIVRLTVDRLGQVAPLAIRPQSTEVRVVCLVSPPVAQATSTSGALRLSAQQFTFTSK